MKASFVLCDRCGDSDLEAPNRDWQAVDLPQDPQYNAVDTYHLCPACLSAFGEWLA